LGEQRLGCDQTNEAAVVTNRAISLESLVLVDQRERAALRNRHDRKSSHGAPLGALANGAWSVRTLRFQGVLELLDIDGSPTAVRFHSSKLSMGGTT
jgi:hypothetical protein